MLPGIVEFVELFGLVVQSLVIDYLLLVKFSEQMFIVVSGYLVDLIRDHS